MKHNRSLCTLALLVIAAHTVPSPVRAGDIPVTRQMVREKIREGMSLRARELEKAREMGIPVRGELPGGGLFELMTLSTRVPTYFITQNEDAARSTRTDSVQAVFGGAPGFTLGLWDGGAPRVTHQELAGRAVWKDDFGYATHPHSTHVGGTMIGAGVVARAKGMAFQANLISYEWSFDDLEADLEARDGLLLSNHSYGHARGWTVTSSGTLYWYGDVMISETEDYLFGFYSDVSRDWDEVLNRNPYYLPVTSAGNDRNDSVDPGARHYFWDPQSGGWVSSTAVRDNDGGELGYDCIPDGMSTAKNTLVIGAVVDVPEYNGPEDVEMTTFSSWGPTDDGRIKPDICGNGYMLYSAIDDSDVSYGIYSGTSMASPNVCGSLGLLQARYAQIHGDSMLASTVKALAIHTAREAGPYPGPDYGFGWGLLDTWAAFEHIESDPDGRLGRIDEMTLYDGRPIELYYEPDEGSERIMVTIAWNDPASGLPAPALNDRTPLLVNDVDLRVTGPGGVYSPWILDPDDPSAAAGRGDNFRDNVEKVIIEDPAPGTYVVRISNKGKLEGGSQVVSLVISGAKRSRTWHIFADGSGDAATIGEAVSLAVPGDQIFVFPGTYFEHDIVIDRNLMIKGVEGAGTTTVDADGEGRCFTVKLPDQVGAGSGNTLPTGGAVEIEGLTLRGGLASGPGAGGRGGALYCKEACVLLSSCVLESNEAEEGGAICLDQSRSLISGCMIHDNVAPGGGGLYLLRSDATVENSTIVYNNSMSGGGMIIDASNPEVRGCTVSNNGGRDGSGLYIRGGGRARISVSIVSFGGDDGSGIFVEGYSTRPLIECCDVYGNGGGDYGGLLRDRTGIDGNISADPLYCRTWAREFTLGDGSPCLAHRNSCGILMGAHGTGCHTLSLIRVKPDGTGDAETIADAMAEATAGDTILLAPGTFSGPGNRDLFSRGMPVFITSEEGAEQTMIDCAAGGEACYGFYFGGGEDTSTVLEKVTVSGAALGAIVCENGSGPLVRDCVITGNHFMGGWHGGGISVGTGSSPVIRRCLISDNSGSPHGGGVFCKYASPVLEDCEITGNMATGSGGGVASFNSSHPVIRRCLISGNTAVDESGGGVYVIMGSATVEGCRVTGNAANYGGGGLFSGTSATLYISRTLVAGNSSVSIGGGVYSAVGMQMSRCTVVDNYTEYYGAGIEVFQGPNNHIDNTIVAFNRNAEGIFTISGNIDIRCSDVFGNEGGNYGGASADMTGPLNVSEDPFFCDAEGGDYHLDASSPVLTPPDPSCGVMGALGVRCGDSADLLFSSVAFDTTTAGAGRTVRAAATVRNAGPAGAGRFRVDFYSDLDDPPAPGDEGDLSGMVDTLPSGDSTRVMFDVSSPVAGMWRSWLLIDTSGLVTEYNRDNNTAGPFIVSWTNQGGVTPERSGLRKVGPNPFAGETEIVYDLDRHTAAEISIYDLVGRRLKIWELPPAGPGRFIITWPGTTDEGRQISSGVYFIRFKVDGVVEQSEKVVRIR
jgi:hypothetical protein